MSAVPYNPLFGLDLEKKALFFRQVATMVQAGIPVGRALHQASGSTLEQLGRDLGNLVDGGTPLSQAMGRFPQFFSPYEAALVAAGEQGGLLERTLRQLADSLERSLRVRRDLLSKLVYPLLIIHVGIFIPPLYLLVLYDARTYVVATVTELLLFWGLVLVGMVAWRAMMSVAPLKRAFDTAILYVPLAGSLVAKLALAKFLGCMSQLYEAGFLPAEAMRVSGSACGNRSLEERIWALVPVLDQGLPPSAALARLQMIPPVVLQLLATGEQTGAPADMLRRASEMLDEEAQYTLKKIMVLVPVVLLLLMGVVVGAYVIHFYTHTLGEIMGQ